MYISFTLAVSDATDTLHYVAVIMDGNDCWTTGWHLPRVAGHGRGLDAVRTTAEAVAYRDVGYLTLSTFSSENQRRPAEEVTFLMKLFMTALCRGMNGLHDNGIRLRVVGNLSTLSPHIQLLIREAEAKTVANPGLIVTILTNYGGRWGILWAVRVLLATQPGIVPDAITEEMLAPYMALSYVSEPDLFTHTGNEQYTNNFLLWQLTHPEPYSTDCCQPDFDAAELGHALA